MTTTKKLSPFEEQLLTIRNKITHWNELTQDIDVPAELIPAIMSGRAELVCLAKARPMSADEVKSLYRIIEVLLETNQTLQEHARLIAHVAEQNRGHVKGLATSLLRLEALANLQSSQEEEEDE